MKTKHIMKQLAQRLLTLTAPLLLGGVGGGLLLTSCSDDGDDAPRIDGVWYNMVSRPIEQAPCAYPGQTLCLRGTGFNDLKKLTVNGTAINLNNILVYASSSSVTFQVPSDVNTTGDNIHLVTANGKADYSFIIRPTEKKPVISSFSSTTLIAGRTLTISGSNLSGATEVWLPQPFEGRILCELSAEQVSDDSHVYVVIPADAAFATGRCEIIMEKTDEGRGITYTEKVFSSITNFKN